jgi:hypothetical protein
MLESMEKMPNHRVTEIIRLSPYRDHDRRQKYGEHLLAAGFPL